MPPPPTRPPVKKPAVSARYPVAISRSAFFVVSPRDEHVKNVPIQVENGPIDAKIVYTGPIMDQRHARVWLAVLNAASSAKAKGDEPFTVPATQLLRLTGVDFADDQPSRRRLWALLKDLQSAQFELKTGRQAYIGSPINDVTKDDGHLAITLNRKLALLLVNEVLLCDLERLASLGRDQMAMWLHNWISSHQRVPRIAVAELHRISGSAAKLKHFRQKLKSAIERLKEGNDPLVLSGGVDPETDTLDITKSPTSVKLVGGPLLEKAKADQKQAAAVAEARKRRAGLNQ